MFQLAGEVVRGGEVLKGKNPGGIQYGNLGLRGNSNISSLRRALLLSGSKNVL